MPTLNSFSFSQPAVSSSVVVPTLVNGSVVVAVRSNDVGATVTGVTFGGVTLTVLDIGTTGDTQPTAFAAGTFAGVAIPSGTQTITINGTVSTAVNLSIWYFENTDQTNPVNAHGFGNNTTATASMTTTATTFIVGYLYGTESASSPLTHNSGSGAPGRTSVDSVTTVAAGAFTNTWTPNPTCFGGFVVGVQAPQTSASSFVPQLLTLNVG